MGANLIENKHESRIRRLPCPPLAVTPHPECGAGGLAAAAVASAPGPRREYAPRAGRWRRAGPGQAGYRPGASSGPGRERRRRPEDARQAPVAGQPPPPPIAAVSASRDRCWERAVGAHPPVGTSATGERVRRAGLD